MQSSNVQITEYNNIYLCTTLLLNIFKSFPLPNAAFIFYPQLFFTYYRTTFLTARRDNVFAGSGGYVCMYPHLVAGQAGVAQGGQVGEPAGLGGFSSLRSAPPSPTTWDKTQQIRGLHPVNNFTNNRSVLKVILFT
jgi:hypothetical protein